MVWIIAFYHAALNVRRFIPSLMFCPHNTVDFIRFLQIVFVRDFKARLNDLAHAYVGTPMSSWESNCRSEHFRTFKSLRSNNSIVITRPDKGYGVVILDYQCYVNKMMSLLSETSKFMRLGPVDCFDHSTSIEIRFLRSLVEIVKRNPSLLGPHAPD